MSREEVPGWTPMRNLLWASVMPLGMVGVVLLYAFWIIMPIDVCLSETKETLSNLGGLDFAAVETDCDALAKDAAMRVFVSKTGESEKTLLFRYTPVWWVPPPEITVDAQRRSIAISVAMVEGIDSQLKTWNGMTVSYDIWKPDDPRLEALRRQRR